MPLFGDKVSNVMNEMKLNKEISDLESKKQALTRSLLNEVGSLKAVIQNKYTEIGYMAYTANEAGNFTTEVLTDKFAEINATMATIAEKEAKINEICGRYDEEISLLRNLNSSSQGGNVASVGGCPKCNTPVAVDDMFCQGCGNKLT